MKIRKGFVANSSSSTFICDYSWEAVDAYDGTLIECTNGHNFYSYNVETLFPGMDPEYVYGYFNASPIPAEKCPACTGKAVAYSDYIKYVESVLGGRKRVLEKLKGKTTPQIMLEAGLARGTFERREMEDKIEENSKPSPGHLNLRRDECLTTIESQKKTESKK